MLNKLSEKCNIIELNRNSLESDFDYDSLIPAANIADDEIEAIKELEHFRSEKIGMDCLPEDVFNDVLESCFKQGGYIGFRDALYFIIQASWGVRWSDAIIVKRIDFINENGKFRDSCLFSELKTGKPRTMYITDTIKMCVLMVLWNGDFNPLDYLIVADSNCKNYLKVKGADGKIVRKNGKQLYVLDKNGNKIPQPLTYAASRKIMIKKLVDDLGIQLRNVKNCPDGKLKIATHSLRKLYSAKVAQTFERLYGADGQAHTAAMEFLNWDLNHSSIATTSRYCGDFENCKREINLNMKLGYEVVSKYFEVEKAKQQTK